MVLAKRNTDGYFWFVGRADDIIKTSLKVRELGLPEGDLSTLEDCK